MLKILDRYVISQYFWMILSGTLIVLGVVLSTTELASILEKIVEWGLPGNIAILLSIMYVPGAVVNCAPAAVLIAAMLVHYKQSMDGEIVALVSSGVSFLRILYAPLLIGLTATMFCFLLNECVVPQAHRTAKKLFVAGVYKTHLPSSQGNYTRMFMGDDLKLQRLLMVDSCEQHLLKGVVVLDFTNKNAVKIISAASGLWEDGNWILQAGRIYHIIADSPSFNSQGFQRMVMPEMSAAAAAIDDGKDETATMNWHDLHEKIEHLPKDKSVPPHLLVALHRKLAQPLACLILALAGVCLAIVDRRSRVTTGLIYGALLLLGYFVLQSAAIGLAINGRMVPWMAIWAPNVIIGSFAMALALAKARWL